MAELRPVTTLALTHPRFVMRALNGHVELAIAEALRLSTRAHQVTGLILASLEMLEGETPRRDQIMALGSGPRAWLVHKIALRFWPDLTWFEGQCPHCDAPFDLDLPIAHSPFTPAGPGYPVMEIDTQLGRRTFEAPNGYHEVALAQALDQDPLADPRPIMAALLSLHPHAKAEAEAFSNADLDRLDDALDTLCPQLADWVETPCPSCQAPLELLLDPFTFGLPREGQILRDVHILARSYGWREGEVLDLPRNRRSRYVDFSRQGGPSRAEAGL
ncbi:hypothetical protein [Woodsholea maritima]|uniref:hypothetical protein n=1 Tax=Woodsholea maritima TaxID=240237 RepID=UPI00036E6F84|nr:hypothetical protein [Woodsholea maritima]